MKASITWLLLKHFRFWAKIAMWLHKPTVIGITGSVGKSTARDIIYSSLRDSIKIKSLGNANSQSGIPLGILGITLNNYSIMEWLSAFMRAPFGIFALKGFDYLLVEMGIDGPNEPANMHYLTTIIKPDIAVLLNAALVHSEQFRSGLVNGNSMSDNEIISEIAKEKAHIITNKAKLALYNCENLYTKKAAEDILYILPKVQGIPFYTTQKMGSIYINSYEIGIGHTKYTVTTPTLEYVIRFEDYILPREIGSSVIVALQIARYLGISIEKAIESLEKNMRFPPGRSTFFNGIHNSVIVDSTYNASKESTLPLVKMLYHLADISNRPFTVIFGDIRELGESAEQEHNEVAKELYKKADHIYLLGPLTKKHIYEYLLTEHKIDEVKKDIVHFETIRELGEFISKNLEEHSIVLIKGSQNTIFLEEALKYILSNPEDEQKLCRQSEYWMSVKKKFLN